MLETIRLKFSRWRLERRLRWAELQSRQAQTQTRAERKRDLFFQREVMRLRKELELM